MSNQLWRSSRLFILLWALLCIALALVLTARYVLPLFDNIEWKTVGWAILIGISVVLLVWLLWSPVRRRYAGQATRSRWFWRSVTALIVIAIGIGVYRHFSQLPKDSTASIISTLTSDTTFTAVARPGQPVVGIMPVGWRMDWWGDSTKFNSHVMWHGRNKARVFTVKDGVNETELKIRIYPCSAEAPC